MNPNPQTPDKLAAAVKAALSDLQTRCVENKWMFRSEHHFETELAAALRNNGMGNVETQVSQDEVLGCNKRIDILADAVSIELKYFTTKHCQVKWEDENTVIPGAPRLRSDQYNFWEDVWRIEQLIKHRKAVLGYVVCICNNLAVWEGHVGRTDPDWLTDFRMRDGRTFPSELKLREGKKPGYWKKRMQVLRLSKEYTLQWQEWNDLGGKHGRFRYVVVEIRP